MVICHLRPSGIFLRITWCAVEGGISNEQSQLKKLVFDEAHFLFVVVALKVFLFQIPEIN